MTTATKKKPAKPLPALIPGLRHSMYLPQWHPATVNQIYGNGPRWWKGASLKKRDRKAVAICTPKESKIDPDRPIRRMVHMVMFMAKGQRRPDSDGVWKSVLDALVHAGMLRNDSPVWCGHTEVEYIRRDDETFGTSITVEDI